MGIFSRFFKQGDRAPMDDADVLAHAVIMRLPEVVADGVIRKKIDVNAIGKARVPALNIAIGMGNLAIAEILLNAGANPNVPDPEYQLTPIILAVVHHLDTLVPKLIARGANVNAAGKGNVTALGTAIRHGKLDVARVLLSVGADPNTFIEPPDAEPDQAGTTGVIYAASVGNLEMLDLFLTHGADPNRPKHDGLTPLLCGIFNAHSEVVKRLVAAGAKIASAASIDPIELAEIKGQTEIAAFLREARLIRE